jgi:hypothetical protein
MPQSQNAQIMKKVKKLSEIAEALRQGSKFHVTRLTIIKSLCAEPQAATAFALFLSLKIQKKMRQKNYPQQFRELVDRVVKELTPYLADPSEERQARLSSLSEEMNYVVRFDPRYGYGLIPSSAPLVEEIAEFWRNYYVIKE